MLVELFKSPAGCVSDLPKVVHFLRIRHGVTTLLESPSNIAFNNQKSFCNSINFDLKCVRHEFYGLLFRVTDGV